MDGIEKITGRIAADTEAEIASIQAEARRQADEITARYEAQAKREAEEIAARGRRSAEERQARLAQRGSVGRPQAGAGRQAGDAGQGLRQGHGAADKPADGEYVGLLAGLAAEASSTGREEVILSQKDRARYGKQVVTQANERLGDGHLTLSVQTRPIRGGLILSDGDVEVNCTFETLVRLLRGEMDRTVVEVLFG